MKPHVIMARHGSEGRRPAEAAEADEHGGTRPRSVRLPGSPGAFSPSRPRERLAGVTGKPVPTPDMTTRTALELASLLPAPRPSGVRRCASRPPASRAQPDVDRIVGKRLSGENHAQESKNRHHLAAPLSGAFPRLWDTSTVVAFFA